MIPVTPSDLDERRNGGRHFDVSNPDESEELECLIAFARPKGVGNGNLLGVVKGKTDEQYIEGIKSISKDNKIPVVSFESDGIYSFTQIVNSMMRIRNEYGPLHNDWFKTLLPIKPISEDIRKAYEAYVRALIELETKA